MDDRKFVKPQKEINEYLNIVKGFGIIFVVLGHCIQYGSGKIYLDTQLFFKNEIFRFLYSFHMPLFMLISGYLFWFTVNRYSLKTVLLTRFSKYILPVLIWNTIVTCIFAFIKLIIQGKCDLTLYEFVTSYLTCLWFLWAIFWCSLIVLFIHTFLADSIIAYVVLGIFIQFIPHIFNTGNYISMYRYFVIGYIWNKYRVHENLLIIYTKITTPIKIAACAFISILCFSICFLRKHLIFVEINRQLFPYFYDMAKAIFGSAMVLIIIYILVKSKKQSNLWIITSSIGSKSLGIYIIHGYITNYILFRLTKNFSYNLLIVIFETIVIIAVSYWLTSLLEKQKITSKLFLGGR